MDRTKDWGHLEGRPPSASPVLCPVDPVQERDFGKTWASRSVGGQLACLLCLSSCLLGKKWRLTLRRWENITLLMTSMSAGGLQPWSPFPLHAPHTHTPPPHLCPFKVSCVHWDSCISKCSPGQRQFGFLDRSSCDLAFPSLNLYPVKM